jgi:hypothetical protein
MLPNIYIYIYIIMKIPFSCNNENTDECELELVKNAVDKYQAKLGQRVVNSPDIIEIINILETFLRSNKLLCYGGVALNNILPKSDQFYNKDIELPDYDFYSINAIQDATKLSDIYYSKGYTDVEAKAGAHVGTYKVYVNFMPVADITMLPETLFTNLYKNSIVIDGIHYVPVNFLRMSIYKELCNPDGDVSRFEKIYKRLLLLNKHYPFKTYENCGKIEYKRKMYNRQNVEVIYNTLLNVFLKNQLVFFGGHALTLYASYIRSKYIRNQFKLNEPDFDVFANNPILIIKQLETAFKKVNLNFHVKKHEGVGELLKTNYELMIGKDTVGFIYSPTGCYSYNTITIKGTKINIASIDTMLFMYFIFYYIHKPYYQPSRILCMTKLLFSVQVENKYSQKGILARFPMTCYGYQAQIEEIKSKKAHMYNKLKHDKTSKEYQRYFFKYVPNNKLNGPSSVSNSKTSSYSSDKSNNNTTTNTHTHTTKTNKLSIYKHNKTQKNNGIFGLYNKKFIQ